MRTFRIILVTIIVVLLLHGCATPPTILTKTVTQTVQVEKIIPVPAELTADCPAAPLAGSTVGAVLDRLASVEAAWGNCREQIALIRELGTHAP